MDDQRDIGRTAAIVAAYVTHNPISPTDLPTLISGVHKALLAAVGRGEPEPEAPKAPAVPIRRSIQPDHIVCLEDGRKFKSLKRHLRSKYALSPEAYRAKWGLPKDYPMVAPAYAAARSQLAKAMGLGRKPGPRAVSKTPRKRAARAKASA